MDRHDFLLASAAVTIGNPAATARDMAGGKARCWTTETANPEEKQVRLKLAMPRPNAFALRLRVPSWCADAGLAVNGVPVRGRGTPDQWWLVSRVWRDGDTVTLRVPRLSPIDTQHPNRVAVMHGPLQMAQDARYAYPIGGTHEAVLANLSRIASGNSEGPAPQWARWRPFGTSDGPVADLVPLCTVREKMPYRSCFDLDRPHVA